MILLLLNVQLLGQGSDELIFCFDLHFEMRDRFFLSFKYCFAFFRAFTVQRWIVQAKKLADNGIRSHLGVAENGIDECL